jgi:hypothetical protein
MSFIEAYQKLFDEFIESRGLDIDDLLWPEQAKAEYAKLFAELCVKYGRDPL